MLIIIQTIKYSFTYYNTFTMGVCSNYHGYFFQCIYNILEGDGYTYFPLFSAQR